MDSFNQFLEKSQFNIKIAQALRETVKQDQREYYMLLETMNDIRSLFADIELNHVSGGVEKLGDGSKINNSKYEIKCTTKKGSKHVLTVGLSELLDKSFIKTLQLLAYK